MGYMTVEEVTQEVAFNIGAATPDPVRYLRWINWAVQNLASYVILDELLEVADIAIADGATEITTIPTDILGIISIHVWDSTAQTVVYKRLKKMRREFFPVTQARQPTHYKRRGTDIITWPEADTDYTGEIEYVKVPAKLTSPTSVTPFAAMWDVGIVQLTTHYGLEGLRQHDEADRWLGRFLGYVASRKTEVDISADMPKGGVNVAWDADDVADDPSYVED